MKDFFYKVLSFILTAIVLVLLVVTLPITLPLFVVAFIIAEINRRKQLKAILGEKEYEKLKFMSKHPDMPDSTKEFIRKL